MADGDDWTWIKGDRIKPTGSWKRLGAFVGVAGITFHADAAAAFCRAQRQRQPYTSDRPPLELRRDPANAADPNAVAVFARHFRPALLGLGRPKEVVAPIGHLPAETAAAMAAVGDVPLAAEFNECALSPHGARTVRLWVLVPKAR